MTTRMGGRIKRHGKFSDTCPPAPIMKTTISSCKISQSCALPVPAEATPQPGQRFLTPPSASSPLGRLVLDDGCKCTSGKMGKSGKIGIDP